MADSRDQVTFLTDIPREEIRPDEMLILALATDYEIEKTEDGREVVYFFAKEGFNTSYEITSNTAALLVEAEAFIRDMPEVSEWRKFVLDVIAALNAGDSFDHGDDGDVVAAVQRILRRSTTLTHVDYMGCWNSSRMTPNHFGGFAARIYPNESLHFSTSEWLHTLDRPGIAENSTDDSAKAILGRMAMVEYGKLLLGTPLHEIHAAVGGAILSAARGFVANERDQAVARAEAAEAEIARLRSAMQA